MVLDEQHRQLEVLAQFLDERAEVGDLFVVEAAGRLVEEQELRPRDECARELDALQRPERETRDGPLLRGLPSPT